MRIRKHSPSQEYLSWAEQFPLFQNPSAQESQLFARDPQSFRHQYPEVRLFPDPFLNRAPRPASLANLQDAVIVAGTDAVSRQVAANLCGQLKSRFGIEIPVIPCSTRPDHHSEKPYIIVGSAKHNPWSRRLMQRMQLPVFDRDFPGAGGWGVTTYHGIQEGQGARFVLACDGDNSEEATEWFLNHAVAHWREAHGESPQLHWVHRVRPGDGQPRNLQSFDTWLRQRRHTLLDELDAWLRTDHTYPYRNLFTDILLSMKEGPVTYNSELLDLGIEALHFYQLTGDEQGLHLFREMLWGLWSYLHRDEANLYISDMDFRLGHICGLWSWVQHHPAISTEERRIFPQVLLAAMRLAHAYYLRNWASQNRPPGTRHNHQTFKARCLILGWRYFRQLHVPDAQLWKQDADAVFEALDASRTKFVENANAYERFVPEHLLAWHEITGQAVGPDFQHALAVFAQREWALTDNFFYRVEYGDCDVSFGTWRPFPVGAWLDERRPEGSVSSEVLALEAAASSSLAATLPNAIQSFCPLPPAAEPGLDHAPAGWTVVPLEPRLQDQYSLQGPPELWFDKLAWRSGWREDSSYLAIEGFGNKTVSHSHNAVNSVVRANFGGRVWLVGNGYGKRVGVKSAARAFSTRELGPVDHNMLIVRDAEGLPLLPPVNGLLIDHGSSPLPYSVTEAPGYGGCRWTRHVFVLSQSGLIAIDSLVAESGRSLPREYSLEWNILGDIKASDGGAIAEQAGATMEFQHLGTAKPAWDYNASTSWHRVMENHEYPHTSEPLQKCVLTPAANAEVCSQYHFVSGFWTEGEVLGAKWKPGSLVLELEMKQAVFGNSAEHSAPWGSIRTGGSSLRVRLRAPDQAG